MKKPYDHICANCHWYIRARNICVNCDSPSDIRELAPSHACDGGGVGADDYGFKARNENE